MIKINTPYSSNKNKNSKYLNENLFFSHNHWLSIVKYKACIFFSYYFFPINNYIILQAWEKFITQCLLKCLSYWQKLILVVFFSMKVCKVILQQCVFHKPEYFSDIVFIISCKINISFTSYSCIYWRNSYASQRT